MKIFLINLDRNQERLSRMEALIGDMDLEYERISAVDGTILSASDRALWTSRRPDGNFYLSHSEVGCYLSHRAAWTRIAALENDYGLVLEDDVHFSADSAAFLKRNEWIPADADIVKIETVFWRTLVGTRQTDIGHGHALARLYGQHFGMAGYIVSPACARKLLSTGILDRAIDQLLFDPAAALFHELRIYQIIPALCVQDQFIGEPAIGLGTDIERGWKLSHQRKTVGGKIRREAQRLYAQMRDTVVGRVLSPVTGKRLTRISFGPRRRDR